MRATQGLKEQKVEGTQLTQDEVERINRQKSHQRSQEVKKAMQASGNKWSEYGRTMRPRQ